MLFLISFSVYFIAVLSIVLHHFLLPEIRFTALLHLVLLEVLSTSLRHFLFKVIPIFFILLFPHFFFFFFFFLVWFLFFGFLVFGVIFFWWGVLRTESFLLIFLEFGHFLFLSFFISLNLLPLIIFISFFLWPLSSLEFLYFLQHLSLSSSICSFHFSLINDTDQYQNTANSEKCQIFFKKPETNKNIKKEQQQIFSLFFYFNSWQTISIFIALFLRLW